MASFHFLEPGVLAAEGLAGSGLSHLATFDFDVENMK